MRPSARSRMHRTSIQMLFEQTRSITSDKGKGRCRMKLLTYMFLDVNTSQSLQHTPGSLTVTVSPVG